MCQGPDCNAPVAPRAWTPFCSRRCYRRRYYRDHVDTYAARNKRQWEEHHDDLRAYKRAYDRGHRIRRDGPIQGAA